MSQNRRQPVRLAAPAGGVVRRHRPDYQLVLFSGILLLIGLVVLYSISPARVELINQSGSALDQAHFMQKQFLYLGIGLAAFAFAAKFPLNVWQRYSGTILVTGLVLCVILAFLGFIGAGIALKSGGATRWYNLGFTTFQPAEIVKFGLLLYAAVFLGRKIRQGKVNDVSSTLTPLLIIYGIAMFLVVVLQKDMGTGITLTGILATMLYMAGLNKKYIATGITGLAVVGILLIIIAPHRIERVITFFTPRQAGDASTYHIDQALIAIGSGGFFGKGLGEGVQAFGYLPEALNDSIFAILGEDFGFVGLIAIIAVFFALLLRLLKITDHLSDPTMRILVAGVFGWIGTHVIINIGSMLGVFPLTGVTLPMISFGGTSLLFIMLALGLAFQSSRYTSHSFIDASGDNKNRGGQGNANSHSGRRIGRPRNAGSRSY